MERYEQEMIYEIVERMEERLEKLEATIRVVGVSIAETIYNVHGLGVPRDVILDEDTPPQGGDIGKER